MKKIPKSSKWCKSNETQSGIQILQALRLIFRRSWDKFDENTLHKGLPDDKLAALLLYYCLKKPLSKVIHPTHEYNFLIRSCLISNVEMLQPDKTVYSVCFTIYDPLVLPNLPPKWEQAYHCPNWLRKLLPKVFAHVFLLISWHPWFITRKNLMTDNLRQIASV